MVFPPPFPIQDHFIHDSLRNRTFNSLQISHLNPYSPSFEQFSVVRPTESTLNPLTNCLDESYSSNEVLSNYILNPLVESFSPQSFIVENQGEIFPNLNSNYFSVNIIPESSPPGLMFVPMFVPMLHLPANCFSPVQTGPSNMVTLNHTLNPLADSFSPLSGRNSDNENTQIPISERISSISSARSECLASDSPNTQIPISEQSFEPHTTSLQTTINDFSDLDVDITPQIFEYSTPDTSFNDSFCCQSEINLIEFFPI